VDKALANATARATAAGAPKMPIAKRVIENLLNPRKFLTAHPPSSVAACDPKFELRMWRGPSWNSMAFRATRGCMRYGR
jgi:hypothetical protein